jgi:ATP-dependent DNA helicase RecG
MTTPVKPLPDEDPRIVELLNEAEGPNFDCKRVGNVDSALKAAVAFANGDGGVLALGVEDTSKAHGRDRLFGIGEKPEALAELQRQLEQRIVPRLAAHQSSAPTVQEIPCVLRDGTPGHIALVFIHPSTAVHSIQDGGTYVRVRNTSRQLTAPEIIELGLKRGTATVVEAPVEVPFELLDTSSWKDYRRQRQLTRPIDEQMRQLGLAKQDAAGAWRPTLAAVLLFADFPGDLLNSKFTIRLFHYRGFQIEYSANTNLVKPPKTITGPVIAQIRDAARAVLEELGSGVQVTPAGFELAQQYPVRVIREAITNAVLHRDYRIQADIHIRIFANRIEIESPGCFPAGVTPANLREAGSRPRNRTLVTHLREFPEPPNLDAGEGVRMMFATMEQSHLYPPVYQTEADLGREAVVVKLLNEAKVSAWDQVETWLKTHDSIGNADLRLILNTDKTVKASKMLRQWVDAGLLVRIGTSPQNRRYRRKGIPDFLNDLAATLSRHTGK